MRPGRRDDLEALLEREFIESQEACGMVPLGQYRDLAGWVETLRPGRLPTALREGLLAVESLRL